MAGLAGCHWPVSPGVRDDVYGNADQSTPRMQMMGARGAGGGGGGERRPVAERGAAAGPGGQRSCTEPVRWGCPPCWASSES